MGISLCKVDEVESQFLYWCLSVLKFTGERYIPSEQGEIRLEHVHRYCLARTLVRDKVVLDIACGEGFGSALMAEVASEVVGIDLSPETVAHAQETYGGRRNVRYVCANALQTGLPDACIDVVVSFETIEHLSEHVEMLAELQRVLRPDGVLLISSPNRPVYNSNRHEVNKFHIKELDLPEFDALLKRYFQQIDYYGQRLVMGTVVQPLNEKRQQYDAYADDGLLVQRSTVPLTNATYFVAVCGPAHAALPKLSASILLPGSLDLVAHYTGFARWAQLQDQELANRDANVRHYQGEALRLDANLKFLRQEIVRQKSELAVFNKQREQYKREILRIEAQLDCLKAFDSDGDFGRL
jgi:ubiquinone/menaquinone biosynthesis C-methylase UbiE